MVKLHRNTTFHTRRDAWVEVDLGAIEHNIAVIRRSIPSGTDIMAVLKADAYGHGSLLVLPTLEASGIGMVGVASMDEAIQIREAKHKIPVLVLGATPDWAMHYGAEHDVQISVFTQRHVETLQACYQASQVPTKVHIKVDTGMHRIGVPYAEAAQFITYCQQQPALEVVGVFSHLACAGDEAFNAFQAQRFDAVMGQLKTLPPYVHLSNSAASWTSLSPHLTMVRTGIALFGYPSDGVTPPETLRPAMGLKARVVHLSDLLPEEGVSYGHTYCNTSGKTQRLATLPLGYGDGVMRSLSNKIEVLFRGGRLPQRGTITMDQLMVDVTGVDDIQVGDVVTLIGQSGDARSTLTAWAESLGTIEYELMCALRVRLPKTVVR